MVKRSAMEVTMCKVLNKHRHGIPAGAVYVGRGSKWGNPFRIGVDGDRAMVIARYATWLRDQHDLLRALDELRGKNLVCSPGLPRRPVAAPRQRQPRRTGRMVARPRLSRGTVAAAIRVAAAGCTPR